VSYDHEDPTCTAIVQVSSCVYLFVIHQGHEEVWGNKENGPTEIGRRNANNGEGMLVDLHHLADDASVIVKTRVPIRVAKDDIWGAVGPAIIGVVKKSAEIRLNA